jgi:deoxyribodipyrimidine photo-lyase
MNAIFWFRRDLRLFDHKVLHEALTECDSVFPIFIFDSSILDHLQRNDHRVQFIFNNLEFLNNSLESKQKSIQIFFGKPSSIFKQLIEENSIQRVYTSADYEPYARKRDGEIAELLKEHGIELIRKKDGVIFEQDEVVKDDGSPYVVFTPYKKKWMGQLNPEEDFKEYDITPYLEKFNTLSTKLKIVQVLSDIGFSPSNILAPTIRLNDTIINNYEDTRNFPSVPGTSQLGTSLRFGTISIRQLAKKAYRSTNHTFLSELIWREFFQQILWHFPKTVNYSFKPAYDRIEWRNAPEDFGRWKEGKTGYALVDAGMRELNATGYMHNRVRMLVASFLCKHLLIDWRLGEAYFAEKLFDFELASNVGNWQWAAGSGVDAAPYFRIFNPITQVKKFDADLRYIRKWVPEFESKRYQPMVDHKFARERCLSTYKQALNS